MYAVPILSCIPKVLTVQNIHHMNNKVNLWTHFLLFYDKNEYPESGLILLSGK